MIHTFCYLKVNTQKKIKKRWKVEMENSYEYYQKSKAKNAVKRALIGPMIY
jgi:hypothetical protein